MFIKVFVTKIKILQKGVLVFRQTTLLYVCNMIEKLLIYSRLKQLQRNKTFYYARAASESL